jgi:hypothetical protein
MVGESLSGGRHVRGGAGGKERVASLSVSGSCRRVCVMQTGQLASLQQQGDVNDHHFAAAVQVVLGVYTSSSLACAPCR